MALAVAEKGLLWITLEARGEPGQSMLAARGSSAIVRLSQAIAELDAMNDEQVTPPQEIAVVAGTAGDHRQRLTVNVGTVAGGTFFSHAASRARAEIDFRIPPGLTIADIDGRLDEIAACIPDLSHTHVKGWDPNWSAPDAAVARAVGHAAHAVRGAPPARVVRLPASDASRWRARGVPAVCFGPQPLLASGVDDYVVTRDVFDCAKIYALAALSYFADPVNG